jgi:ABC-type multidrug transport system fused ATPase/permease subunit
MKESSGGKNKQSKNLSRLITVAKSESSRIILGLLALLVNSATNLSFPWIIGKALDEGKNNKFILGSFLFFMFGSAASWVRVYCLGTATERIVGRLRKELFDSFMEKDMEFFDSTKSGELITVLEKDVNDSSEILTEKLANGLRSLNSSINGSILLYVTSPKLCYISLSIVPIIGVGAMMLSKYSRKLAEKLRNTQSEILTYTQERFTNFSSVKLNGKENFEKKKYSKYIETCDLLAKERFSAQGNFMSFINIATNISLFTVLKFGGNLIANNELTSGQLARFAIQVLFKNNFRNDF